MRDQNSSWFRRSRRRISRGLVMRSNGFIISALFTLLRSYKVDRQQPDWFTCRRYAESMAGPRAGPPPNLVFPRKIN
jgi:hypothetical protein